MYRIPSAKRDFTACRSTQHCAYHGWCHRCAKEFAAIMSDVNRTISDTGVPDTFRGSLYSDIGKTLMAYFLNEK